MNEGLNETDPKKAFDVGVTRGTWIGIGLALSLILVGAVLSVAWRWSFASAVPVMAGATPVRRVPFELSLVYNNVPFIGLSEAAVRSGLNKSTTRQVIEREMATRWFFEQELLRSRTRYAPLFDKDSLIIFTDGEMKRVAVRLMTGDGKPGRYGLIPFDAFDDDVRSLSK